MSGGFQVFCDPDLQTPARFYSCSSCLWFSSSSCLYFHYYLLVQQTTNHIGCRQHELVGGKVLELAGKVPDGVVAPLLQRDATRGHVGYGLQERERRRRRDFVRAAHAHELAVGPWHTPARAPVAEHLPTGAAVMPAWMVGFVNKKINKKRKGKFKRKKKRDKIRKG